MEELRAGMKNRPWMTAKKDDELEEENYLAAPMTEQSSNG